MVVGLEQIGERRGLLMVVLLAALLWAGSVAAEQPESFAYTVEFEGIADQELKSTLEAVSDLKARGDRPPASPRMLERRARQDQVKLEQALRALGYYDPTLTIKIDDQERPLRVLVTIDPGAPYLIRSVVIRSVASGRAFDRQLPTAYQLGLKLHAPLVSRTVLDAENRLLENLRHRGYPFAVVAEREVIVDHRRQRAEITLVVDPDRLARFGEATFTGVESVALDFLKAQLPWQSGDRYDGDLLNEARKRLVKTDLFSLIQVSHADQLTADGRLPITVLLRERKPRTVRGGLRYGSDAGIGARLGWEHRNLWRRGERLRVEGNASSLIRQIDSELRKPNFYSERQALIVDFQVADETTDAYVSSHIESQAMVERNLIDRMFLSLGLGLRYSTITQVERDEFTLVYVPARFTWDTTENRFDPSAGGRLEVKTAPYLNCVGDRLLFFKNYLDYSHYLAVLEQPQVILAARAVLGGIAGNNWDKVPADLRFYAGGGGSIRGYSYQSVGPLDADGDPLGGNSLVLVNAEARLRLTETIGMAVFLDGGSAFADSYPAFDQALRWGAGTGLRYHTPVGPLRLDFAIPLNRRDGIDDSFQIYISLGQAF